MTKAGATYYDNQYGKSLAMLAADFRNIEEERVNWVSSRYKYLNNC